jgi:hypothetical protein
MLRDRISSFVNVGLPLSPGLSRNRKLRQIHFTGYCVYRGLHVSTDFFARGWSHVPSLNPRAHSTA